MANKAQASIARLIDEAEAVLTGIRADLERLPPGPHRSKLLEFCRDSLFGVIKLRTMVQQT